MAISKLNAEQFANMAVNAAGVIFEYAGKDGKNTAMHFFGADYEATVKTQDEMFRVLRNVVTTFWEVKTKESLLRESNDGIRSKLRAGTPHRLIIRTSAGITVKIFDLDASVWARIGLMPTKKDLERSARDRKKYIHNATKALMEALNFRVELPQRHRPARRGTDRTACRTSCRRKYGTRNRRRNGGGTASPQAWQKTEKRSGNRSDCSVTV